MKDYKLFVLAGVAAIVAVITYGAIQDDKLDGHMAKSESMSQEKIAALQQARQAFWARDLVSAENSYRQLIENGQASADAWGELGNVYYLQAKWPQTAEAYTEAALLLIDANALPQAMYLHHIVMRMDGQQAMRIDEKMRTRQVVAKDM